MLTVSQTGGIFPACSFGVRITGVARRKNTARTPISLGCHRVRQNTVRVRCCHRPFDDHFIEGDLESHTEHVKLARSCVNPSMVLHKSTGISQASSESASNATWRSVRKLGSASLRNMVDYCAREGRCDSVVGGRLLKNFKNWSQIQTYRLRLPLLSLSKHSLRLSLCSPCRCNNGSCSTSLLHASVRIVASS